MSQIGRRREGFRMEGRDVNNDMAEIKRMLKQLEVRIDRIEARRRGRKSSDGERNVTTYHQRIDRIETFDQEGDGFDGEICVGPVHKWAPLCESDEEGTCTFNYPGCKSTIFNFPFVEELSLEKEKNSFMDFDGPPRYDDYRDCEVCVGGKERLMGDEDVNEYTIESIWLKDIMYNFVDFIGVHSFFMEIPKTLVHLVNQIKGDRRSTNLMVKRNFLESGFNIYSKYIFIWKGRIQVAIGMSKQDQHRWKILWGILSIKGTNSRTNSFQPKEFDAGAYKATSNILFVI